MGMTNPTRLGWLFRAYRIWWKPAKLPLPQQPLSRTDVFLSAPFNSSSFITLWGEPSNSWTFESTLLGQRFPVGHALDEYITPSTNSNYWQHAKCLQHGPRIYAEYILCCGADKRVDSANEFKCNAGECECAWPETMKEKRRRDNRYNKNDDFICRNYKRVCKCPWWLWCSLQLGWVTSLAGMVAL